MALQLRGKNVTKQQVDQDMDTLYPRYIKLIRRFAGVDSKDEAMERFHTWYMLYVDPECYDQTKYLKNGEKRLFILYIKLKCRYSMMNRIQRENKYQARKVKHV